MLRSLDEKTHLLRARIMHSDCFKLKGLLCLCNAYTSVASARIMHRTRILPESLRLSDQAPEVQVLRFTNVVWLHYRAALVHKIFGVSVNVIHNLMHINCLLMIGSVLSNYFLLIVLIIIGNDLRLRGLNSLDMRGDGIRSWISKSRTISDGHYMGCTQSALLLSPSLLSIFFSVTGEGTEIEPSPLNETRSAPHLRLSVGGVI